MVTEVTASFLKNAAGQGVQGRLGLYNKAVSGNQHVNQLIQAHERQRQDNLFGFKSSPGYTLITVCVFFFKVVHFSEMVFSLSARN